MKMRLERTDVPWKYSPGSRTFWEVRTDDHEIRYVNKVAYRHYEVEEFVSNPELAGQKFTTLEAALKAIEVSYDTATNS